MPTDIAIVAENPSTAVALEKCLNASSELHVVGSYSSGVAALKSIPRKPPNLVLVDFKLGDMPGLECVRRLHLLLPELFIVLFNAEPELKLLFESLSAGATGFLDKLVPLDEIPTYAQLVMHGGLAISRGLGHSLTAVSHCWQNLTERESSIANQLLAGKREGGR